MIINHYVDKVIKELMDGLGLSIPPFTGKPWWTSLYNDMDNPVKKEQTKECDGTESDVLSCIPSSVKRQKRNCDDEDNDDN